MGKLEAWRRILRLGASSSGRKHSCFYQYTSIPLDIRTAALYYQPEDI